MNPHRSAKAERGLRFTLSRQLGEGRGEGAGQLANTGLPIWRPSRYIPSVPDANRARALRQQSTWAEKLLWRWLRDRRFSGYKFRRQHPVGIYVLDFYCGAARLNVGLDGSQHGHPDQRRHDQEREAYLLSQGIKTLRF